VKEQAELNGLPAVAGGAVGARVELHVLDEILHAPAGAIDLFVEAFCPAWQVGDDEAYVAALLARLDAGDDLAGTAARPSFRSISRRINTPPFDDSFPPSGPAWTFVQSSSLNLRCGSKTAVAPLCSHVCFCRLRTWPITQPQKRLYGKTPAVTTQRFTNYKASVLWAEGRSPLAGRSRLPIVRICPVARSPIDHHACEPWHKLPAV
jgi:hypothetical protein